MAPQALAPSRSLRPLYAAAAAVAVIGAAWLASPPPPGRLPPVERASPSTWILSVVAPVVKPPPPPPPAPIVDRRLDVVGVYRGAPNSVLVLDATGNATLFNAIWSADITRGSFSADEELVVVHATSGDLSFGRVAGGALSRGSNTFTPAQGSPTVVNLQRGVQ